MIDWVKKLTGELIDIVEWLDDSSNTLVYRYERNNNEIKYGAKLTVREGQMAVFINEGQMADVYKPGMYTLTTQNMPILSTLKGWKYGFESPFKAEVYFVNTRKFTDLKWGTPGPCTMRDKEFGIVRVTSFGIYSIRIKDPGIFIKDISGTEGRFTTEQIQENLRGKIGMRIKEVMPELGLAVIDLEAKVSVLGTMLRERISPDFEAMGLELVEVQVQDIGLPEEVEKAIDKRGAIAAIGNMQAYTQYETASAIHDAATTPNSAAGAGMGLGAGFAMGGGMVGQMAGATGAMNTAAAAQTSAAPPPLPAQAMFHVAVGGAQAGPFDMGTLQTQVNAGTLKRDVLVWKAGMAQWTKAGDVSELADLFANLPPPLPV